MPVLTTSFSRLVISALLCAAATAGAQESRRGFIGLGIGPSLPFGSFADPSLTNVRGGRAFSGYTDTFLNIGYRGGAYWGVAALFSYSEYVMKNGGDDDWWQVAELAAGPMYTYPLGPRGAVDLKGTLAYFALTPVVDSYTTGDRTGSGLGFDVRAAVRYDVFRAWAIFAEGGVQASNVSFPASGRHTDLRALVSGLGIAYRPRW